MVRELERRRIAAEGKPKTQLPDGAVPITLPGSCPRESIPQIRAEICRVATAWCGLPLPSRSEEIIRIARVEATEGNQLTFWVEAPLVLKEKIEMLQATVGLPASPLERATRLTELLARQKRQVGRNLSPLKRGQGKMSEKLGGMMMTPAKTTVHGMPISP